MDIGLSLFYGGMNNIFLHNGVLARLHNCASSFSRAMLLISHLNRIDLC